ncbi:MAG: hypothetical protein ACLQC7_08195 [Thermoplasmata archaeon]
MTTRFEIEPYKRVSIRTIQNLGSAEKFFEGLAGPVPPGAKARIGPVFWANGLIFGFSPYAPSEAVSREYLSGHLPWDNLDFASLPTFEPEVKLDGRDITFVLKDVSKHSLFGPLTEWIGSEFLSTSHKKAKRR